MLTFAYQARDTSGKTVSGVQEALNEQNAINLLMSRGLMVLSIQQKAGSPKATRTHSVSETDLVLFTRQLATMVDAGLPLVSALTGLYEQCDSKKQATLKKVIAQLTAHVQEGASFAEALNKHPKTFDRLYVSMIRAGESGGLLAQILSRLASFLEASARLKKKIKSAMTYPVIVVCIALAITTFLIVKVVPVFGGIFADFGANLPAPTQMLLSFSDFLRSQWYAFILLIAGALFGTRAFLRSTSGRDWWDRNKLKLPVFGPLAQKIAMTRFARTFAQLLRSGIPILEVLQIVGDTSGNVFLTKAIQAVAIDVEKGDHLTSAMARHPIFPPMMLRMIGAGESTGKIDEMLEKMADFWDEEIEAVLAALTSLIEPFLIVFLGVFVGGIVIAMFLPIFKLSDVVSGSN